MELCRLVGTPRIFGGHLAIIVMQEKSHVDICQLSFWVVQVVNMVKIEKNGEKMVVFIWSDGDGGVCKHWKTHVSRRIESKAIWCSPEIKHKSTLSLKWLDKLGEFLTLLFVRTSFMLQSSFLYINTALSPAFTRRTSEQGPLSKMSGVSRKLEPFKRCLDQLLIHNAQPCRPDEEEKFRR